MNRPSFSCGTWLCRALIAAITCANGVGELATAGVLDATPQPLYTFLPDNSDGDTGLVLIAHGTASNPGVWANQLKSFIDPQVSGWDVVAYDWSQHAGTTGIFPLDAEIARTNAKNNVGPFVAQEIVSKGYTEIHFVGHSAGSWLIDSAADLLDPNLVIHTTFLDAYTPTWAASGNLSLGDSADWSEHFVDTRPVPFTNSVLPQAYNIDVTLLDTPTVNPIDWHSWPHEWYRNTAADPNYLDAHGWGFQTSLELGTMPSHTHMRAGTARRCPRGHRSVPWRRHIWWL